MRQYAPIIGVLVGLALDGCTPAQRDAVARDAAAFGRCAGVKVGVDLAGALLELAAGAPVDSNAWGAWGRGIAGRFGRRAVECGAELLAQAPGVDQVLVDSAARVGEPAPIGFRLPSGPTAGPASAPLNPAAAGSVTLRAADRAAARWLATHPDSW